MTMREGIGDIVGKTISHVVVAENERDPRRQLFLVFSDGTFFELYGESFGGANGVDRGGIEKASQYARGMGAKITRTFSQEDPKSPSDSDTQGAKSACNVGRTGDSWLGIRTLLWKVCAPYEVRAVKRQLRELLEGRNGVARNEIERLVLSYIKRDPGTVVDAIRLDHKPVEHVALALLTGILRSELVSGDYHTYRGMLSMSGEDMHRVWLGALSQMVERGYFRSDDADSLRTQVREEIKSVG